MKTLEERQALKQQRIQLAKEKAEHLKVLENFLGNYELHVVHLRPDKMNALTDSERPLAVWTWLGEPCTVASIHWANGRLFTISRVNAVAGDKFCRKTGRFTVLERLFNEIHRLKAENVDLSVKEMPRRYGWFYFTPEWCGRDSLSCMMPMYAASQILLTQNRIKHGLPERI